MMNLELVSSRAEKRKAGYSLREIGDEEGISRQAVQDSLVKAYGTTRMTLLLNPYQLSQAVGLSLKTVRDYRRRGIIKPLNAQKSCFDNHTIEAILAHRKCKVCGTPLPIGKTSYCSPKCEQIGRYKAFVRYSFRMIYKKKGRSISPSCAYVKGST